MTTPIRPNPKPPVDLWKISARQPTGYSWDAEAVDPKAWFRLIPVAYADQELLNLRAQQRRPNPAPFDQPCIVDIKVVGRGDVRGFADVVHVSEAFMKAMVKSGATGFRALPVPHGTSLAVRGRRAYALDLRGFIGRLDPSVQLFQRRPNPARPIGYAGAPVSPVVFDGTQWNGEPVCWTEWFDTNGPSSAWRALVVRGSFLHALAEATGGEPGLLYEAVEVNGLADAAPPDVPGDWVRAPLPRTDARSLDALFDHLEATARAFDHHLPPRPTEEALDRVLGRLEQLTGKPCHPKLRDLLRRSEGASLFRGSIGILPCTPRQGPTELVGSARVLAPNDDLLLANDDARCDELQIVRPRELVVFGWRTGEFPSFWAMDPSGQVRLLSSGGDVLGPEIPLEEWLDDQIVDLELAWSQRDKLSFMVGDWLGYID